MSSALRTLQAKHKEAARMKVRGVESGEIAETFGVTPRTVYIWFGSQIMKDYIAQLERTVEDRFADKLASVGMGALSELSTFSKTEATRVQAVCKTCGWWGPNPVNHGDPDVPCTGPWEAREFISETTKLAALSGLLDRIPETALIRDRIRDEAAAGGDQFYQMFLNMPDHEMAEILRRWASGGADGNPGQPVIEQHT